VAGQGERQRNERRRQMHGLTADGAGISDWDSCIGEGSCVNCIGGLTLGEGHKH
jgi:hypothetical protein